MSPKKEICLKVVLPKLNNDSIFYINNKLNNHRIFDFNKYLFDMPLKKKTGKDR
jgi:hypothetical protein